MRASYGSSNYILAVTQLAQTTLRSVIGKLELDKTFEERDIINAQIVAAIDEAALNWGVKVLRYEIKDLTPPNEILHAMQRQITAEREKRALIAASEGRRQEQINIATGEREAFIARSEGEKQAQINNARRAIVRLPSPQWPRRPWARSSAAGCGDPPAWRRAGRTTQGGGTRGRRLRQGRGRRHDHADSAKQHERNGRPHRLRDAHGSGRQDIER